MKTKHIIYIVLGLIAAFLIYWFFFRKKKSITVYSDTSTTRSYAIGNATILEGQMVEYAKQLNRDDNASNDLKVQASRVGTTYAKKLFEAVIDKFKDYDGFQQAISGLDADTFYHQVVKV